MMVNCPKCHFLQPKDQYCANCGVNMETWRPPQRPLWKRLVTNWIFQLTLLFLVIFVLVLQDSFKERAPETPLASQEAPPIAAPPKQQEPPSQQAAATLDNRQKAQVQQRQDAPAQGESQALQEPETARQPEQEVRLKKQGSLRVMLLSRNLLSQLISTGENQGENSMVIAKKELDDLLAKGRQEFQTLGAFSQRFSLGQDMTYFVGEEDLQTGLSLGFFLQVNVNEGSRPERIQMEARQWNQLQLSGDASPPLVSEVTLTSQQALVVIDLLAHELDFTQEERNLFEASQRLRAMNESVFVDGGGEIVLVLTLE